MSKGPPPPIKPKPKNLVSAPAVGKKPAIDLDTGISKLSIESSPKPATDDNEYIASLRGNLRKTGGNGVVKNPIPLPGDGGSLNAHKQATIDSVVSKPISMSMDMSDSEDEQEEGELDGGVNEGVTRTAPVTPGRRLNSHTQSQSASTLSPFKKSVDKSGFPLPPQRNNNAIASTMANATFASPLKNSSYSFGKKNDDVNEVDGDDIGEGMRSPLKRNNFLPPPKRSLPPMIRKEEKKTDGNHEEKAPSLPSRKPKANTPVSNDSVDAPKLPVRRKMAPHPRPSRSADLSDDDMGREGSASRGDTASDVEHEYEDEYANERSVHVAKHPLRFSFSRGSQEDVYGSPKPRRNRSGSSRATSEHYGEDDDLHSENGFPRRSSSSLLLDQAKTFSKDSYHIAKEKSAPYAKQAMGGLNKMKDKIKSSMNKEERRYDDDSDDDDDRYSSLRRSRASSKSGTGERPQRPPKAKSSDYYDDSDDDERDYNDDDKSRHISQGKLSKPNHIDESFDEDRPPLPARRDGGTPSRRPQPRPRGIPLPGLADDDLLKPPHKIKPDIPLKKKPAAPVPSRSTKNDDVLRVPTPPAKRASSNSVSSGSVPPPAPPSRNKAPPAPPSRTGATSTSSWKAPDLDFEFSSLWFAKDDQFAELPKDLKGLNYQCSYGFAGKKAFKNYAFRLSDLATLKLKITWTKEAININDSLSTEVKFIPPPTASATVLKEGHEKFGEHIANWCEVKEGQTVGDGECWTLAHDALERACGKFAFVSSGLNHGALIATYTGTGSGVPKVSVPAVTDDLRRGDILQFKQCVFKYPQRTLTCGMPDHTAVILDVKPSDDSEEDGRLKWLEIIHQNMGGVKKVRVADIDLGKLVEGELKVYRPVPVEWITDLSEIII